LILLLLVFIVVPIAELYVIWQVADAIGIWATIAVLFIDSIVGSLLLKSQGRAAWRRFNEATAAGRIPGREVVDGALIIFGGAFLITPGFISDFFGLLFLLPPTRAVFRKVIVGVFAKRSVAGFVGTMGAREFNRRRDASSTRRSPGVNGDVVDGTATDYDEPARRLDP
jgi:UPF0716 protein FxsA